jgi:hypothetical protein
MFCQIKCRDVWVVQKWLDRAAMDKYISQQPDPSPRLDSLKTIPEHWDTVKDFELDDYDKVTAFAMDLSLTKKTPLEMAVFEEGKQISGEPT